MAVQQMPNISIGRYACAEQHGWGGWIEPEHREWIMFVPAQTEQKPEFYFRDPVTGAVLDTERFEAPDASPVSG